MKKRLWPEPERFMSLEQLIDHAAFWDSQALIRFNAWRYKYQDENKMVDHLKQ